MGCTLTELRSGLCGLFDEGKTNGAQETWGDDFAVQRMVSFEVIAGKDFNCFD